MLQVRAKEHQWRIHAYCLMNNHYHLVLRLGSGGLSRGMRALNCGYAQAFNAREGRRDHLFGRRFWSLELHGVDDLLTTSAYVDRNPSRSFDVAPQDWPWSSYRGPPRTAKGLPQSRGPLADCKPTAPTIGGCICRALKGGSVTATAGVRHRHETVTYVTVYSGPLPPSGGVRRPPLAVIAPHWTQFDGASFTSTVPSPSASPAS